MKTPFLIVGVPRSGTTLLAAILANHRGIHIGHKSFSLRLAYLFDLLQKNYALRSSQCAIQLWNSCIRIDPRLSNIFCQENANPTDCLRTLVTNSFERIAVANDAEVVGDKAPDAIQRLKTLSTMIPNLKTIQVVRDPRPNIASLMNRQYMCLTEASMTWVEWNTIGLFHKDLVGSSHLVLKYEDLVQNTRASIQAVCEFLDVEYSDSLLDLGCSEFTKHEKSYVSKYIDTSKLNQWKNSLHDRQVKKIEQYCGTLMSQLEYERIYPNVGSMRPTYGSRYLANVLKGLQLLFVRKRQAMIDAEVRRVVVPLRKRLRTLLSFILRGVFREELLRASLLGDLSELERLNNDDQVRND